jgi:hydrogenase expression/formation protein HypC
MCLGVPGKVIDVYNDALGIAMGKISFSGIVKDVCLAYTPEAQPGEYVVVHAGFAISLVDEQEAMEVFKMLEQMDELAELEIPQPT